MNQLLLLCCTALIFSSCSMVQSLERNRHAIDTSTCSILENTRAIEEANSKIAENTKKLSDINKVLEKAQ